MAFNASAFHLLVAEIRAGRLVGDILNVGETSQVVALTGLSAIIDQQFENVLHEVALLVSFVFAAQNRRAYGQDLLAKDVSLQKPPYYQRCHKVIAKFMSTQPRDLIDEAILVHGSRGGYGNQ
jgi:hypothetical protein